MKAVVVLLLVAAVLCSAVKMSRTKLDMPNARKLTEKRETHLLRKGHPTAPSVYKFNAPGPVFRVNLPYAVYTAAPIARPVASPSTPYPMASTWLNPPYWAIAYTNTGATRWQNTVVANTSEFVDIKVVAPRHVEPAGSAKPLDRVVAGWLLEDDMGQGECDCVINGFNLASSGETAPVWQYTVAQCLTDFVDSTDLIKISDDGTTVAVLVSTNSTLPKPGATRADVQDGDAVMTVQLHVIDVSSGKLLYAYSPDPSEGVFPRAVSITAHGEYVAFVNGAQQCNAYVVGAGGRLRAKVNLGLSMFAAIDATGSFLLGGYESATMYGWNPQSGSYNAVFSVPGSYQGNTFFLYAGVFSSNNGNPLVSLGWTDQQAIGVRVDLYTTGGQVKWTYVGPLNEQDQNIVAYMSAHLNYVAVATWGSFNETENPSPQVLLFNDASATPAYSFITPGSMFACDVAVSRTSAPLNAAKIQVKDSITLTAAGKDEQANTMGYGGDFYAFNLQFSSVLPASQA